MEWLLRNARTADGAPLVDIAIQDGKITALSPAGEGPSAPAATQVWDLAGRVVLPGLVDAHTHLDKTYLPAQNHSGTLLEAIDIWRGVKATRRPEEVRQAARRAVMRALANGVTAMRSHVDTEIRADLAVLEALVALREEIREFFTLQLVALGDPAGSGENRAVMESAMALGADVVGGAPAIYADARASIDAAFALAQRHGKPMDLHTDETEDPAVLNLAYLAEQTVAHGMQAMVTAGHCCSLGFTDDMTAARVIEQVAAAQINVVTLPSCNLVLMGRGRRPAPRGITPVRDLRAHGVRVCAASDNVQDPFNPFGSYDLLQIANLNAHVAHMSGEEELYAGLEMVTRDAAAAMGLSDYGVDAGMRADLVVLDTPRVLDAVISPPARLATFVYGKLVTRAQIAREWHELPAALREEGESNPWI